jgi:hypothetical protein
MGSHSGRWGDARWRSAERRFRPLITPPLHESNRANAVIPGAERYFAAPGDERTFAVSATVSLRPLKVGPTDPVRLNRGSRCRVVESRSVSETFTLVLAPTSKNSIITVT